MIKNSLPAPTDGRYASIRRSLKKGEDCAPALWLRTSVDYSAGVSDFLRRWRRFASLRIDVAIYRPTVSPSSLVASIISMMSFGTREAICVDLLLVLPVAIADLLCNRWLAVYSKNQQIKSLKWLALFIKVVSTLFYSRCQSSEARQCCNTNRASDHNVTEAYTMAGTQHTQTHSKYQYRFMALLRADMTAAPCRLTIEATSEQEARQRLSGRYILSFAGCIPAQEVRHV